MSGIKLSVGIPAYNEEKNIGKLLRALLSQESGEYELLEILVVSDGSTDATVQTARAAGSALVKVIDRRERKGAAETQNDILDNYIGEVLVMLDADVVPAPDYLAAMVKPFYSDRNIGVVSNQGLPFPARTFFGAILNFSLGLKEDMARAINGGDNVYSCHGYSRAFSRRFTDMFRWSGAISEDAFSYFECKRLGFVFVYDAEAKIYFTSPSNFRDHLKQSNRFTNGQRDLQKFVDPVTVRDAHRIPFGVMATAVLKNSLSHPVLMAGYVCTVIASSAYSLFNRRSSIFWESVESSKSF